MRTTTLVMVLVGVLVLSIAAFAQVTFTPPGGTGKFTGKMLNMRQTSIAQRLDVTGSIVVGQNSAGNQWAIRAKARNLRPNGNYALALANSDASSDKVLAKATAGADGTVTFNWVGTTSPMSYTDIALYHMPSSSDQPGHGAIRLLSVRTSDLGGLTSPSGAGPRKKPAAKSRM